MPPDVKRQVQMIIMRGQKPVALKTGQFGLLSMPLFAEVSLLPFVARRLRHRMKKTEINLLTSGVSI
jgi:hypothetical protein